MVELVNIEMAARMTGLAKGTLYNMVSAGTVPHIKLGRRVLFREEDLGLWIDQHRRGPLVVSSPPDQRREERR
jgi:excisionase family DNA binding protein